MGRRVEHALLLRGRSGRVVGGDLWEWSARAAGEFELERLSKPDAQVPPPAAARTFSQVMPLLWGAADATI